MKKKKKKPWHGKRRLVEKEDEIGRKGNLPKLPGMGAAGIVETSTVGTEEAGVVGTAETGAEGAAGIGTTGVAGAVIPTPATISGPSEVSASREITMQMKRKYNQKKKNKKGKRDTYPCNQARAKHSPLHQNQKFSFSARVHHQDPQECHRIPLRISPYQDYG